MIDPSDAAVRRSPLFNTIAGGAAETAAALALGTVVGYSENHEWTSDMIDLPTPSGYRQSVPVFPSTEPGPKARRFERKRLIRWFVVAVALHAALFLGIWLSPPLRLKWDPAPEQWVSVTSVPKEAPGVSSHDAIPDSKPTPAAARGTAAKGRSKPVVEPVAVQPLTQQPVGLATHKAS